MLVSLVIGLAVLLALFQCWWSIAYIHAYRQVHAPVLLVQVAQGLAYVLFFVVALTALASGQNISRVSAVGLLVAVVLFTIVWRVLGGPALMARYYPRRGRDVLSFRRPAVDLKRRVRTR